MDMTKNVGEGSLRFNTGKVRMTYIPPAMQIALPNFCRSENLTVPIRGLVALAEHFTLGATKYPDEVSESGVPFPNWAKGQLFDKMLLNSTLRHVYAFYEGESLDSDFGSHHLIAAAWGIVCLHHQFSNYELYKDFDDRMFVGFNDEYVLFQDNFPIICKLMSVSTQKDLVKVKQRLVSACFDALSGFQSTTEHSGATTYTVDSNRLEKIKNTDYGIATSAKKR